MIDDFWNFTPDDDEYPYDPECGFMPDAMVWTPALPVVDARKPIIDVWTAE